MIDAGQPDTRHRYIGYQRGEVDIVDRPLAVAIDEVDQAAADPFNRRDVELHRPNLAVNRLRTQRDRALIGLGRVGNAEGDRAD